jgi:glutamate/aspartate transport system substrate-binding protein
LVTSAQTAAGVTAVNQPGIFHSPRIGASQGRRLDNHICKGPGFRGHIGESAMKRTIRIISALTLALFAGVLASTQTAAQESSTLKKIKETGTITLGVREASVPFSYLDDKQQYIGYSIDLCMKVVDAVKADLKMPNLKVAMTPVTSQTRIPLLANGTIDLECGSTTNSVERQKQVDFLVTTFVTGTKLLAKKSSNIHSYKDLKGKTVVVTSGTTNERVIKELSEKEGLGMSFIQSKDHDESFLSVDTGRAVAFPMDDILLYGLKAKSKNPAEWDVIGEFLSDDPYAIMAPKNDPTFKKIGDNAIIALMKSGEIHKIYNKWFEQPIPPKGIIMSVPESSTLKEDIKSPNDKGVESCARMKC